MAESSAPTGTEGAPTPTTAPAPTTEPAKPDPTADDLKAALKNAHKESETQRKAAEALQAKLKEYEDKDKSELDKTTERATTAESRAAQLEQDALRLRVAYAKGLPFEMAGRLVGTTEAEMQADADNLLKLVAPATTTTATADGGARGQLALNGDPLLRDVKAKLGIT